MWTTHTMEDESAMTNLAYPTKDKLKNMLTEGGQAQKASNYMKRPEQAHPQQTSSCQGTDGEWEVITNGYVGSFWGDENMLTLDLGNDDTTLRIY